MRRLVHKEGSDQSILQGHHHGTIMMSQKYYDLTNIGLMIVPHRTLGTLTYFTYFTSLSCGQIQNLKYVGLSGTGVGSVCRLERAQ